MTGRPFLALAFALAGCKATPSAPPPAEPEVQPCTTTLHLAPVGRPSGALASDVPLSVSSIRWLDERTLVVLVDEGEGSVRGDGLPRRDDERLGVLFYDLRHTDQTQFDADHPPNQAPRPDDSPMGSFPVRARQLELLRGKRVLLLAGETGVASLEIDTGCLRRAAGPVPTIDRHATGRQILVALDGVHGRFYFVSGTRLVRVDADHMDAPRDAPLRDEVAVIAYDAVSDRVVIRTQNDALHRYDGTSLAPLPDLPMRYLVGGPWVRPGHAQAMIRTFVPAPPCKHREPERPQSMLAPRCLDPVPPGTLSEHRLALIDLATGAELLVGDAGTQDYDVGAWSGDGDTFLFESFMIWRQGDERPHRVPYGSVRAWHPVLDTSGQSYAFANGWIVVGDLATGEQRWTALVPRPHSAEH